MQRRTKRQPKNHSSNGKKKPQTAAAVVGLWSNKPGEDMSLLLSRVRGAQVRRLHFR